MKFIHKFITAALLFITAAFSALGQADVTVSSSVTAATPLTLLTGGGKYQIYNITFFNSTSAIASLRFYDSAGNSTSMVRGAYTSYETVATNWTSTFTNAEGIVITNTFNGVASVGTSVAATTNERPVQVNFSVVGSGTRTVNVSWLPALGATVYSTQPGVVEVGYKRVAP